MYHNDGKKYIFSYTILYQLYIILTSDITNTKLLDKFITTNINTQEFALLFNILNKNLNNLKSNYEFIFRSTVQFQSEFNRIINLNKRVHTYIKIRQDTSEYNNRYTINYKPIQIGETQNKYISINYLNTDAIKHKSNYYINKSIININDSESNENYQKELYMLGPYDEIFKEKNQVIITNQKIVTMIDKISTGQDTIMITYGQSGSGKTSTFIYLGKKFNKITGKQENDAEDGLIILFCKHENFTKRINIIKLSICEVYVNHAVGINNESFKDPNYLFYRLFQAPIRI
jgi:hypothetical protein